MAITKSLIFNQMMGSNRKPNILLILCMHPCLPLKYLRNLITKTAIQTLCLAPHGESFKQINKVKLAPLSWTASKESKFFLLNCYTKLLFHRMLVRRNRIWPNKIIFQDHFVFFSTSTIQPVTANHMFFSNSEEIKVTGLCCYSKGIDTLLTKY